jgi:hypothetical protein
MKSEASRLSELLESIEDEILREQIADSIMDLLEATKQSLFLQAFGDMSTEIKSDDSE